MYRSMSRFPEFAYVAIMPFGYLQRVFNIFPFTRPPRSNGYWWRGGTKRRILLCRFPWGSERVIYPFLRPLYKERRQKVIFSYLNPSDPSQSSLLQSGYSLSDNTSPIVISHEQTLPFPETPCPNKTWDGSVRARMAETQDLPPHSFSQNPKQGLVTPHFRRDWVENLPCHLHPLSHEHT